MFLDNIKNIGADAIKQIENEIAKVTNPNGRIPPTEIKLRGIYDDCHINITIDLFYKENTQN